MSAGLRPDPPPYVTDGRRHAEDLHELVGDVLDLDDALSCFVATIDDDGEEDTRQFVRSAP